MTAKDSIARFRVISDLQQLAEWAFVHKLKVANPSISERQIRMEVSKWYKLRPGAEYGDGVGRIGDPSRFE